MTNAKTNIKTLSAAEAADALAARFASRRASGLDIAEDDEDAPIYTCECCGCHEFAVESHYISTRTIVETVECTCADGPGGIAAMRTVTQSHAVTERAVLNEEHRQEDSEVINDEVVEQDVEHEVACGQCCEDADDDDWEAEEEDDPEVTNVEVYVRCADCDHEIEFGWSHPDGGRIWPCESRDHNPWMSWPESRYCKDWERRGWLRPVR